MPMCLTRADVVNLTASPCALRGVMPCVQVLEEYEDEEIHKLVDVATAPPARPSSEAPRLLRGARKVTDPQIQVPF